MKSFSKAQAISYGWRQTRTHFWFLVVVVLIIFGVSIIPSFASQIFSDNDSPSALSFVISLAGWVAQMTTSLGLIGVALKIHDKKKTAYSDLFKYFNLTIPYLFASIIYSVIVITGLILLIIPGIIWSIKFQYFTYLMVDRKMGPIQALKESAKITKGVKWNLFFLKIIIGVINIIGALFLGIGLLVTIPIGIMAEAYVYRKLKPTKK